MATTIGLALAVPAAVGTGAAGDSSNMRALKTILIEGAFTFTILIEARAATGPWCQVASFNGPTSKELQVACDEMRVRRAGAGVGTPTVNVSAEQGTVSSADLTVPAAAGVGASTNVGAFSDQVSVFVDTPFGGMIAVEGSSDDTTYAQITKSFYTSGGCQFFESPANYVRVRRAGNVTGTPAVAYAATMPVVESTWVAFPDIRIEDAPAGTRPTIGTAGATFGWLMAINDQMYLEVPLHDNIDRDANIIVGVSWAPTAAEVAKTVTWQVNSLPCEAGTLINGAGAVHQAVDTAIPATAFEYTRTGIVIPSSEIATLTDEFHLRISRIASTSDPVNDPAIHHIAIIQSLLS